MTTETNSVLNRVKDAFAPVTDAFKNLEVPEAAREFVRKQTETAKVRAADLHGVASALVLSCGLDPLMEQAEAYVRRLGEAGVRARHICYQDLIHGAYRMPAVLPGARRMLEDTASALVNAFGRPSLAKPQGRRGDWFFLSPPSSAWSRRSSPSLHHLCHGWCETST